MNSKDVFILGLVLLGLAGGSQYYYDQYQKSHTYQLKTSLNEYIEPQPLSPEASKIISFGFDNFLADYYWLSFIQYYGGGDPYGKYRKLPDLFQNIITLAPKFSAVYPTGLIIMPGEGHVEAAIKFGEQGIKNMPDNWEIPYYTGLVYHMYKKDYISAAKYFDQAAALPNAPVNAKYFAAIYYNRGDERQMAYQIFKTVYNTTTDDFVKERSKKYMEHLEILFALQDAAKLYEQKYGTYPTDLNQLVAKKIIRSLPDDPLNIGFTIENRTVTERKK